MQTTTTARPVDLATARLFANVAERARTLFRTGGYRAQAFESNAAMFFVFPPEVEKLPYIVDTLPGREHCTCPFFAEHGTCKHFQGLLGEIADNARADAEADERTAYQTYGRYDFEDNAEQLNDLPTLPAYSDCLGRPVYLPAEAAHAQ